MASRSQFLVYAWLLLSAILLPAAAGHAQQPPDVADAERQQATQQLVERIQAQQEKPNFKLSVPGVKSASARAVTEGDRESVELTIDVENLAGDQIELDRQLDVTPAQMKQWQDLYLQHLAESENVVTDEQRQLRIAKRGDMPNAAAAIVADAATPLALFRGLPQLPPELEQRIIDRCLMLRHKEVVESPRASDMGPWSFGHLMQELANEPATGISPTDFVEDWLGNWQRNVTVNGFVVPNRKRGIEQLILNDWPRTANHELDLSKSPFRLLSIILRLDLRSNRVLGSQRIDDGGAGEARLVYCAVDKSGNPLAFTVIFEYGINRRNFLDVWQWAREWYALRNEDPASEDYLAKVESLTRRFTDRDTNVEAPPNRSSLNALRTNEIALVAQVTPRPPSELVWEVREFRVDAGNEGHLRQVTVKQTPDLNFNGRQILADFVNAQASAILAKRHSTPTDFPRGSDFLGGSAITPPNVIWQTGGILNKEARHLFSLGTCSGCHAREAFPDVGTPMVPFDDLVDPNRQPPHFTHVRPRKKNEVAQLSAFLTGKDADGKPFKLQDPAGQKNPDGSPLLRKFGDLPARAHDLYGLARFGAFYELFREQRSQVH